ncbi:hypothetical protein [Streptomyces sp. NPDC015125]|uniref:hypothetical protein n=1 Tax=Streptomyces sp. NPDC015125 TaxID=3364938 RepID=UPI0036F9DCFE
MDIVIRRTYGTRLCSATVVAGVATALLGLYPSPASAATSPGLDEINSICDTGMSASWPHLRYRCAFHAVRTQEINGRPLDGNPVANCQGSGDATESFTNSFAVDQSTAYSIQFGAAAVWGLAGLWSQTTTYGTIRTVSQTVTATAKPGEVVWIEFVPTLTKQEGWIEARTLGTDFQPHAWWTPDDKAYPSQGGTDVVVTSPKMSQDLPVGTWRKMTKSCGAADSAATSAPLTAP